MSDAIRNRALLALAAEGAAAAAAEAHAAADAYDAARARLEAAHARLVRWSALAEDAARLPLEDDTTRTLAAVGRCRERIAAAGVPEAAE